MNKKSSAYNNLESILLRMRYDLKKTLSENKISLTEQWVDEYPADSNYDKKYWEERTEKEVKNRIARTYPNYCAFPQQAVLPPKNKYGMKGLDALLEGFCAYKRPKVSCDVNKPTTGQLDVIQLPGKSPNIKFISSDQDYEFMVDLLFNRITPQTRQQLNKEEVIGQLKQLFPYGTVSTFTITNKDGEQERYEPFVCFSETLNGNKFSFLGFQGYRTQDGKNFTFAERRDTRNERQKFTDEYEYLLYIAQFVGVVLASATFPESGLLYFIDWLVTLGIGGLVTYRNIEKGQEVDAALSAFFALLPGLNYWNWLKGADKKVLDELSQAFKNSGLKSTSTAEEYKTFYEGLSPRAQSFLNNNLRNDPVFFKNFAKKTSEELKEDLTKALRKNLQEVLEKNPDLIRKIPLKNRIWFRTFMLPSIGLLTAAYYVNSRYGSKLNSAENEKLTNELRDKLDGIYSFIPEELKQEVNLNLWKNPGIIEDFANDPSLKQELEKQYKSKVSEHMKALLSKDVIKTIFDKHNIPYEDFFETGTEITVTPQELEQIKKDGWILYDDWDGKTRFDKRLFINGELYVKPQKQL